MSIDNKCYESGRRTEFWFDFMRSMEKVDADFSSDSATHYLREIDQKAFVDVKGVLEQAYSIAKVRYQANFEEYTDNVREWAQQNSNT